MSEDEETNHPTAGEDSAESPAGDEEQRDTVEGDSSDEYAGQRAGGDGDHSSASTDRDESSNGETDNSTAMGDVADAEPTEAETDDARTETGDARTESRDERVEELEAELDARAERIDELESRLRRAQADFQNYKKRQKKRQEQQAASATENLVERLLGVRDNLKRALETEHDDVGALREGVKMTLSEFDRVLDAENVSEIDPQPGTDVDPQRHEVLVRVESDHPEDTIAEVYQPGYELGEKVIRAAQVTVSDGSANGADAAKSATETPEAGRPDAETDDGRAVDDRTGNDETADDRTVDDRTVDDRTDDENGNDDQPTERR